MRRLLYPVDADGRPLAQPPTATFTMLSRRFTDPDTYHQWQEACIAWCEWRVSDRRNAIGLMPAMIVPVAAVAMFLLVFWLPADGDLAKLANRFGPGALVEMAREVNSGPTCEGPSYHDGICPEYQYSVAQLATKRAMAAKAATEPLEGATASATASTASGLAMPLFLFVMVGLAVLSPKILRRLVGVVDAAPTTEDQMWGWLSTLPENAVDPTPRSHRKPVLADYLKASSFGRKRT